MSIFRFIDLERKTTIPSLHDFMGKPNHNCDCSPVYIWDCKSRRYLQSTIERCYDGYTIEQVPHLGFNTLSIRLSTYTNTHHNYEEPYDEGNRYYNYDDYGTTFLMDGDDIVGDR